MLFKNWPSQPLSTVVSFKNYKITDEVYINNMIKTKYKFLLLLVIIVNASGLFGGILEPDSFLYAYIAKQMAEHNDFINLYNSTDWLDKPHFPFWITAISFKILGVSSFAYKLPAFLFWLTG